MAERRISTAPDVDVLVVGAGPVGLTLANMLGMYGVRARVVEERPSLIDYPRGVGLDDESLRTFQAIGLADRVLPHTTPNQIMRFVDARRRLLAEIAPTDEQFGWPKRNGFVQPLVDAELLAGLARYPHVEVAWGTAMVSCAEAGGRVTVELATDSGPSTVTARYVVGCDGGRSATRRQMGVSFEGTTSPTRWLVVDLASDPLGHPNIEVAADPARPNVSVSIAHGIRRFEFMIHDDEPDELAEDPAFVARMVAPFVPHPERLEVIRRRVYTHHSRIAGAFRRGRLLLAGDAAHLMPVWQGQGYNSGIRDAANLGWKLAAVVRGQAGDALLDSYDLERRKHARAMIDLSTMVGRVISPTDRKVAAVRDALVRAAAAIPPVKRYVLGMRFKPMPRYERGAVVHDWSRSPKSSVGTLFVQPRVDTRDRTDVLLDEVLGPWFAVLCWNNRPRDVLGATAFERWKALGARFFEARPSAQLRWTGHDDPDVVVVGDRTGALKRWFDGQLDSVLFLRPDRCVAGASIAQQAPELSAALLDTLDLLRGGNDAAGRVLRLAQPSS
ncbi:bifunctional 3-(3-hydroxy-phenyl)propionate/3-hydroxycinnamic acid hydroxylase [Nocardia gamkensis]|uniref:3-(3-hydroxy-phenyl)propionate/3-hydroxycinnamic acid hydroxylase n=1 Tax=Nocardia gamkensis TaxID=352869 RepID=A0A7X6R1F8_9NOCA|nr:bifunctional 3-(3-hydroxy-phenyl)propionate/3-hydroxycinnamic acid hydroxylase [Nocardia gamkensis]NKY25181.1 bifunctional 3-(3-hydroxy-phenyl)propionate/3-hydroxycinnamic acid hydroxylase [Nocardia gamkensis]NQE70176.1 3-(3-hydroxy-phenyl)propionate/3-hydroxycinnamic acid hydroxylase [Nocardia gamkensis]